MKHLLTAALSAMITITAFGEYETKIDVLRPDLFRVRFKRGDKWPESGMTRYHVFKTNWDKVDFTLNGGAYETSAAKLSINDKGEITFYSKASDITLNLTGKLTQKGFKLSIPLTENERVYGLGDVSRKNIMRRGMRYEMSVKNVTSYIPMPYLFSNQGWGIVLNTTWRHFADIDATERGVAFFEAPEGELDFYILTGKDYRAMTDALTSLTGRPLLLPVFGYGLSYVNHEKIDAFGLCRDAREFRREKIPCDILGLEPDWMDKHYDFSTGKCWDFKRFPFLYWEPWRKDCPITFIGALSRMGFKLSLWLCCEYDLFKYEEEVLAGTAQTTKFSQAEGDGYSEVWQDNRVTGAKPPDDDLDPKHKKCDPNGLTGNERWYAHLEKFVDQGARCFKLDASRQAPYHPGRAWANGMDDEEAHSLYSLIYAKQMATGYMQQKKLRPMVYSSCGWIGIQKYVATWAGDTGGGLDTLISIINLGACGHANASCDLAPFNPASLHFGFLQAWSQQNNWCYFNQPWYQEPERTAIYRKYAELRYRLLPYLYSTAGNAALTGWPIVRSLAFEYPDIPEYDKVTTTYMLGDNLLVGAFGKDVAIPPGDWYEWRTGEVVTGPTNLPVNATLEWGGALYVKAGAVIPMWPLKQHVEHGYNDEVELHVWPGNGEFTLYEDDGNTLEYLKGKYAQTKIVNKNGEVTVGQRKGSFPNMPAKVNFKIIQHCK